MKKLFALCLLLATLPAAAQGWVRYAQSEEGNMYFDSLRTRKMGDTAFVWDLHDRQTSATDSNGNAFRSVLYAVEYQCRANKRRVLGIARHTHNMGVGAAVSEEAIVSEWSEVSAGSLGAELFKHICE
jgi:hypothetical protein